MKVNYICTHCHKEFEIEVRDYRCSCGGLFNLKFQRTLLTKKQFFERDIKSLFDFWDLLPLKGLPLDLGSVLTPLAFPFENKSLAFKLDYLSPTGSYKDRGAAALIHHIKNLGIKDIMVDSSGNAAISLSAFSLKAGLNLKVLIPEKTSSGKVNLLKKLGADVELVPGNRQKSSERALELAGGYFYASHFFNPFFFQGVKTMAYEMAWQLKGKEIEKLIIPVGNGTMVLGLYEGFSDLKEMGIINEIPRIIALQAENCMPVINMAKGIDNNESQWEKTIAEGIAVSKPARIKQIIKIVNLSQGEFLPVKESEIISAGKELLKLGFLVESTSFIVFPALKSYLNQKNQNEKVTVAVLTGSGLKAS